MPLRIAIAAQGPNRRISLYRTTKKLRVIRTKSSVGVSPAAFAVQEQDRRPDAGVIGTMISYFNLC
jgi:hypothetical protein